MPIKSEPWTGKIGPYTVFITPTDAHQPSPPVMAPPAQFYREKPSLLAAFFWDTLPKLQNAHLNLDQHVAHWFGLNQSKYQWALEYYYENNEKTQTEVKQEQNV